MQKKITLKVSPSEVNHDTAIKHRIASHAGSKLSSITGYQVLKKSLDARGKNIHYVLSLLAFIDEPFFHRQMLPPHLKDVHQSSKKVVVIGAGPAGLFASLKLISHGIKPVIIERGKDVKERRRDLASLNKLGIINDDSNYCFGEGGAGTYSDGKLYTRSSKRGSIGNILNMLVHFGANENILYEAHPHIGTNKLPQIISAMREAIVDAGGEIHFNTRVTDLNVKEDRIDSIKTNVGDSIEGDSFILATGHSARDIFQMLYQKKIQIEAKPFALGVRIEHPQEIINNIQYGDCLTLPGNGCSDLPPASYSLVEQVNERGVFSFCMCPGGIIAPASTTEGELVVNGWSPSKRNNPYANSGMVVQLEIQDVLEHPARFLAGKSLADPLAMMRFQQMVERQAYQAGGGAFVAPAQRLVDFAEGKFSSTLPECSYLRGVRSADFSSVLPGFIHRRLQQALKSFGRKMPPKNHRTGYYTNEAIVVATESRTSSPVRIPRSVTSLQHPQLVNLYPCGEGAGYAGGIVSAAIDGERVADAISELVGS